MAGKEAPVYDTGIAARLALAEELWDWRPHPGQREFLSLRLPDGTEPRVLVAACGRRWGKTECLGMDVASRILTDPELGQMGVAPTRDQAEGLFDSVEEKLLAVQDDKKALRRFPHVAGLEIKRSPYPLIRNKAGVIVFSARSAGRNGRNLRGKGTTRKLKRFRVILDERAFIPDDAVESAIKPMLATMPGGGQLVEISSPFGKRGGFYDDFVKGERLAARYRSVRLPSSQNPLVDSEYLREMRDDMTDRAFRSEFLAEFLDTIGAVFLEEDILAGVCDDDYGPAPLWGMKYVAGIDFGRRGDWTVCCVLEVGAAGALRLVELFRVQGRGWAAQIAEVLDVLARWGVRRCCPDRTGVGDPLSESLTQGLADRRIGCEVDEFVFTGPSKPLLVDNLAIALSRSRLHYPAHPVLLSELRNFEATPPTSAGGREKLQAAKGHDDCVMALALAVHAAGPFSWRAEGSAAVASAGTRARVAVAASSDGEDFSQCDSRRLVMASAGSSAWAWALEWERRRERRARLLQRLAYRCALGRRVGAWLRSRSR